MESLRLMPPVPMTLRIADKDQWIDGLLIPKGTIHYIPVRFSILIRGLSDSVRS